MATLTCSQGEALDNDDGTWRVRCPFRIPDEAVPAHRVGCPAFMSRTTVPGVLVVNPDASAYVVSYQEPGGGVNIATITWRY